ncbi:uncharacterized protein GGS25DRAFT_74748 [Hypoxylon fragiforme]|uniref:uncharacterized protein n=1 Tax=Hypoxylon fragiforme TaxID=63214 RepID=UPI0020C63660|nr:uncharacterized protein GGS25DRAFT_74748 [Hypoxylon fragiforme]KAI2602960.1 hypothetical protein GGS25DRAFT_74748 [Hypoxylon fragiforme]
MSKRRGEAVVGLSISMYSHVFPFIAFIAFIAPPLLRCNSAVCVTSVGREKDTMDDNYAQCVKKKGPEVAFIVLTGFGVWRLALVLVLAYESAGER